VLKAVLEPRPHGSPFVTTPVAVSQYHWNVYGVIPPDGFADNVMGSWSKSTNGLVGVIAPAVGGSPDSGLIESERPDPVADEDGELIEDGGAGEEAESKERIGMSTEILSG